MIQKKRSEVLIKNEMKDQLSMYKRMRQQHARQLEQLEMRNTTEMSDHKKVLERELEQQCLLYDREIERLRSRCKNDLDTKVKGIVTDDKRFQRQIRDRQEPEMKHFQQQQKSDFRVAKQMYKEVRLQHVCLSVSISACSIVGLLGSRWSSHCSQC